MVNICVIALIGLPGAGKTTLCQNIQESSLEYTVITISYDEIFKFTPENTKTTFKEGRRQFLERIKKIIIQLKSSPPSYQEDCKAVVNSHSFVILCDDNNYYTGMRYEIYKICKAFTISFGQVYIPLDLGLAYTRNSNRGDKALPFHVIKKMNSRLEVPSDKNYWEKNTLVIKNPLDVEKIWDFLKTCFLNPLQGKDEKLQHHTAEADISFIHEVDVALRKRINELLKTSEGIINEEASILNKRRKCILSDIRKKKSLSSNRNVDRICERLVTG